MRLGKMIPRAFLASLLMGASVNAERIFVDAVLTTGANDGTSWSDAHQGTLGLQAALGHAVDGDEIWIAAGTYKPAPPAGDANISFNIPSGVQLYGGFENGASTVDDRDPVANPTVLSGDLNGNDGAPDETFGIAPGCIENTVHVVDLIDAGPSTVLDGLILRSGNAAAGAIGHWERSGGNIRISGGAPVIRDCISEVGRAGWGGGGLAARESNLTLDGCVFRLSRGDQIGSGLAIYDGCDAALIECEISENWVAFGGGYFGPIDILSDDPGPTFSTAGCFFRDNMAVIGGSSGAGAAAIRTRWTAIDCDFHRNHGVGGGGGAYILDGSADFDRCDFVDNEAFGDGGGALFLDGGLSGTGFETTPRFTNCRFIGNNGVAVVFDDAEFTGCTMTSNSLGKPSFIWPVFVVLDHLTISNTIIWNNGSGGFFGEPGMFISGAGSATISRCLIQDWDDAMLPGDAFEADPSFVDLDGSDDVPGTVDDDVRLSVGSPAIDAGDNDMIAAGIALDFLGGPRIADGDGDGVATVDIGAIESPGAVPGDADGDGDVDLADFGAFQLCFTGPVTGKGKGMIGSECNAFDFDHDGDVDLSDFGQFQLAFTGPA